MRRFIPDGKEDGTIFSMLLALAKANCFDESGCIMIEGTPVPGSNVGKLVAFACKPETQLRGVKEFAKILRQIGIERVPNENMMCMLKRASVSDSRDSFPPPLEPPPLTPPRVAPPPLTPPPLVPPPSLPEAPAPELSRKRKEPTQFPEPRNKTARVMKSRKGKTNSPVPKLRTVRDMTLRKRKASTNLPEPTRKTTRRDASIWQTR